MKSCWQGVEKGVGLAILNHWSGDTSLQRCYLSKDIKELREVLMQIVEGKVLWAEETANEAET